MSEPRTAFDSSAERSARPFSIRDEWRRCIASFAFLTRFPTYRLARHDATDLPGSAVYFPIVGLAVGIVGTVSYFLSALLWPTGIAVALAVAATVWCTGAFHEDALADSFDGFGGGWNRDQILTIMKDSRVGSYALIGVVLMVAVKIASLTELSGSSGGRDVMAEATRVARALVAGHVLARWSSVPLIWLVPYAQPATEGARASAGRPFVAGISSARCLTATLLAFAIASIALRGRAAMVIVIAGIITAIGGRYARRRIGGITGDTLGAINQFVELSVYLVLAARPLPG